MYHINNTTSIATYKILTAVKMLQLKPRNQQ